MGLIKFLITTEKPREIEDALDVLNKKLISNAKHGVGCEWIQTKPNEFELQLEYLFQNRASDWILEHELKGTLRKIDGQVEVRKIKLS